jgi:hypothetical protein
MTVLGMGMGMTIFVATLLGITIFVIRWEMKHRRLRFGLMLHVLSGLRRCTNPLLRLLLSMALLRVLLRMLPLLRRLSIESSPRWRRQRWGRRRRRQRRYDGGRWHRLHITKVDSFDSLGGVDMAGPGYQW